MTQTVCIVGVDEAGRGALAGPVVVGACYFPLSHGERVRACPEPDEGERGSAFPVIVRDSKTMSPQEREISFQWITAHCVYGIGMADAMFIDTHGILEATQHAIDDAVSMIEKSMKPTYVLMDGRDRFWFNYPNSKIIRGDSSEVCISAASIIAKVSRDRMMRDYAKEFPQYGFEIHKGYGTASHFAAIEKYGLCAIHRRTFLTKYENKKHTPTCHPEVRRTQ
ncbi:ribonuclease HII [Candidatus Peregrinibacteria bacterium]|nr:ribonuclease HII [Candidatus Peregrinibacteria bacterium]